MFGLFGWFPEKESIKIARLPGLVGGPVNELEQFPSWFLYEGYISLTKTARTLKYYLAYDFSQSGANIIT